MKSSKGFWLVGVALLFIFSSGCACRIGRPEMVERPTTTIVQPPVTPPTPPTPAVPPDPGVVEPPVIAPPVVPGPVDPVEPVEVPIHPVRPPTTEVEKRVFQMIFFDFDKYDIRPDARPILENIAAYLAENTDVRISIEGHCDERGTEEYNMALGERRSLAARRYLINLGISGERLFTVSYGKELPLDPRSSDAAWALNRRCEFKIVEIR